MRGALGRRLPVVLVGLGMVSFMLVVVSARRRLVAVTVRGSSMEPAYRDGDRVLVTRGSRPAPGRVVVIAHARPGRSASDARTRTWLIKRVAAVPGDPVPRDGVAALAAVPERHVPPGKLVLLGDNPDASLDSRQMGYFAADRVLGTVMRRMGLSAPTTLLERR
ncbi:S26 family signal peptidase [Embleya sp. NPDC005575]|uniref:S26 family signal peptidase n=1 Tax=Embleya sp. NPDC005575 TaxID=3156892 RepID=UPI0033ACEB29